MALSYLRRSYYCAWALVLWHLLGHEVWALASDATTPAPADESAATLSAPPAVVVYLYTVDPCSGGLPSYVPHALQQALLTQRDSEVVMASNYNACDSIGRAVDAVPKQGGGGRVVKWDTSLHPSQKTLHFAGLADKLFEVTKGANGKESSSSSSSSLWLQSALRFFHLEDLMRLRRYSELFHVEADNLLYGSVASLLPQLRRGYAKGLACTPLTASKNFFTASVLWVPGVDTLAHFTDFLLHIAHNDSGIFGEYVAWLTPYERRKQGTLMPRAINEMSMMGYYHHLYPLRLRPLPVLPDWPAYVLFKYVSNYTAFAPGGSEITGGPTGEGIWDPGSYGQFLGGTPTAPGPGRAFSDPKHIVGQALRMNEQCRPAVRCGNASWALRPACYSAPYVRCGEGRGVPLWNLHVHSKKLHRYISRECGCEGGDR